MCALKCLPYKEPEIFHSVNVGPKESTLVRNFRFKELTLVRKFKFKELNLVRNFKFKDLTLVRNFKFEESTLVRNFKFKELTLVRNFGVKFQESTEKVLTAYHHRVYGLGLGFEG